MDPVQSESHYLVAAADDLIYTRVVGQGGMSNSVCLKTFFDSMRADGREKFVVDLQTCTGFDSTFMGILLGLVLGKATVVVVNINDAQRNLLRGVGLHHLLRLCERAMPSPQVELRRLEERSSNPRARARVMLGAHENLVSMSSSNREKFGAFVRILRAELGEEAV